MDAFVTRSSSAGPIRASSCSAEASTSKKRLPASSTIPSFFAANKAATSEAEAAGCGVDGSDRDRNGKGKGRERTATPSLSSESAARRASSVPAAHSGQVKQQVRAIKKSLKSHDNPITQSEAYASAFHYTSVSTGHQSSNGKNRTVMNDYLSTRYGKLKAQGAGAKSGVLSGVKAYINGVTTPIIGNLDLIRLVQEHGGEIRYKFSKTGCTHIICVRGLSASKTHKEMATRSRTKVVTPQWVLDSISEGKKLAESKYKIIESETQSSIKASLGATIAGQSSGSSAKPFSLDTDAFAPSQSEGPILISSQ